MRGRFLTLSAGFIVVGALALPDPVMARETEQVEPAICSDAKHRHVVVRPLTESVPIRKAEKLRIRRILM